MKGFRLIVILSSGNSKNIINAAVREFCEFILNYKDKFLKNHKEL